MSEWDAFPVAGAAPRQAAPARQQPRQTYQGPMPTSADDVFASLIAQESGGRAGVRGPDTPYGNALGRTQVLPSTARGIAKNLGIPYREDLLTGTTPEASAYQDQLGRAYLQEGFQNTGNAREALMYYHGGPDRKLWGPKTNAYADEVLGRWSQGQGIAPTDVADMPMDAEGFDAFPVAEDVSTPQGAEGSSQASPIDITGKLYQDQVDALKQGAWVRAANGEVYQLPGDAFTSNTRGSDEAQGGNVFLRRPNLQDQVGAFTSAASEQIPGSDELSAALVGVLSGAGYDDVRASQINSRDLLNQTERGARVAGGVSGALSTIALPFLGGAGYIGRGASGADRAARAFQVGAGGGAAFGFGNTDGGLDERAFGGAVGALAGGATAGTLQAAAPLAADIARRTGSGLSEAGSVVSRGFGRAPQEAEITPQATESAIQYVTRLLDSSGSDIAANPAAALGKPITAAEAIGPSGVSNMAALSRRAGRGGTMTRDLIGARALEQSSRVLDDLASASGLQPGAAIEAVNSLAQSSRQAAAPLYDAAYQAQNVVSPELQKLATRPSMQTALRNAARIAQEEGRDPMTLGLIPNAAGDAFEIVTPSMQTWDYVKRGLDDVLEAYRDPTTRRMNLDTGGRAAESTRQALRAELTNVDRPWGAAYRAALDAGGDAPRVEAAFREGPRLFSTSVNERTFRDRVTNMTDVQRNATLSGIVDDLFDKSRNGRLNLRQLRTPAVREKLSLLMGDAPADGFIQRLVTEADLAATGNRMAPGTNSVTAEALEAMRDQDQGVGLFSDLARNIEGAGPISGTIRTALESAYAPIGGFVRGATAPAAQPVRDEISRLLLQSPQDLLAEIAAFRAAGGSATQAPASAAPAVRAVSPAAGQVGSGVGQRDAQRAIRSGTR